MSVLTDEENENLKKILEDLKFLFTKEEIRVEDIDDVLQELKSKEAKQYLLSLRVGSKPESALREAFFAGGGSILSKYLSGGSGIRPEVNLGVSGFVDYLIIVDGRAIRLELKSLFERDAEKKRLKQRKLDWEEHTEQILKYVKKECKFVVLTNLKEWFFFSHTITPRDPDPFLSIGLSEFYEEYDRVEDLRKYLGRKDSQSIKEDIDRKFFESLDIWVKKLSDVEFKQGVDDDRKLELTVGLINKFIFIQTLDDYSVIDYRWIMNSWEYLVQKWGNKGKYCVLEKFLGEVDEWFYRNYDTELFKENILKYIKEEDKNIELLYDKLQLCLGLAYWQTSLRGGFPGVYQYNFEHIDEDVFGKAYEKYLAKIRKEEGIYYTPKYITQYITENTVGKIFDELLNKIKKEIDTENFESAKPLIEKFVSIKVLDPACGSGSFLIKAIRLIWNKYEELNKMINEIERKYTLSSKLILPKEIQEKVDKITELKQILKSDNLRELVSRIILRHIHGNDLDKRAVAVAKVNIWLEGVKLAPKEFKYDQLPKESSHILPDLEMNLGNGDSLVGLPEDLTIEYLQKNYKDKIIKLFELRKEYLENPSKTELVDDISKIKQDIRRELNERFKEYLKENNLPLEIQEKTKPFHWALEYWYVYFDKDGAALSGDNSGFDNVIGNPPYFTEVRGYKEKFRIYQNSPTVGKYYEQKMDVFYFFIERGLDLLKNHGYIGYIIMEYWRTRTFGGKLREKIVNDSILKKNIDFNEFKVFEEAPGQHNSIIILQTTMNGIKSGYGVDTISVLNPNISVNEVKNALFNKTFTKDIAFEECILKYEEETKTTMLEKKGKSELLEKISKKQNYRIPKKNIVQGLVTPQDYTTKSHIKDLIEKEIKPQFTEGEGVFVISEEEKAKMPFTSKEKNLIKPFYYAHQIDSYYFDNKNEGQILYITKPYIEYDKNDIARIAKEKNINKEGSEKIIIYQIRREYPNIVKHLDRFQGIITSDKKPYGLHRPRDEKIFKSKNKIVSVRKTNHPKFTHVPMECYMNQSVNYIIIDNRDLIPYLLALLNSNLINYYSKSKKSHGEQLQIDKDVIVRYPLYLPPSKQQQPFCNLVDRIYNYKKSHYNLLKLWGYWSTELKSTEYSLKEILIGDLRKIRDGKSDEAWTSNATFYPNEENEMLTKEFKKLKIMGDTKKSVIKVYGLDENNDENLVYEMEFNNRDLMLIIYHSITDLLSSGKRVKTLSNIFSKTEVPVIQPDAQSKTPNILKKVNEEFEKWLKNEKITEKIEPDIVKIDNEIEDIDAHIDALVFNLYELDEGEVRTVMDSLNTPQSYQEKVFNYFKA